MPEINQILNLEITVLSPLHIGNGQALLRGYDFVVHNGRTWRIDEDALFSATQSGDAAFDAALLGRPADELLEVADYREDNELFRYVMDGTPSATTRGAEVAEQIKDVFDRPYLPGSSLKGALRTLLLWSSYTDAKQKPDLAHLNRQSKQAARPLEQELFGRDPNHDWLRALRVRDSVPLAAGDLALTAVRVYPTSQRGAGGLDIDVEAIKPGTVFSTEISLETYGFESAQATSLGWQGQRRRIKELPRAGKRRAKERLITEATYFSRPGRPRGAAGFYDGLINRLIDLPKDALLLQVGWGAGWESKTLGRILQQNDRQFEQLVSRYRMTKQRNRRPGDDFPISRHLALRNGRPALPMGWLQVRIRDLDAVEVTRAPVRPHAAEPSASRSRSGGTGHLAGTVKRFVVDRGFGFITPDGGGSDIFFHISALTDPARTPKEGDRIHFDLEQGPKGPRATNAQLQ